jgi:hypothetical protein
MNEDDFTYVVDETFLPNGVSDKIRGTMLDNGAVWRLGKSLLGPSNPFNTDIDPYSGSQFNHSFFWDSKATSAHWDMAYLILKSFCDKYHISIKAVTRCKGNLTFPDLNNSHPHTETPHVDHNWPHLTFLYYINDAVGDTILYNEKFSTDDVVLTEMARVSPKQGRAILFNGLLYHSPTVPEHGYRAVINFTFFGDLSETIIKLPN